MAEPFKKQKYGLNTEFIIKRRMELYQKKSIKSAKRNTRKIP